MDRGMVAGITMLYHEVNRGLIILFLSFLLSLLLTLLGWLLLSRSLLYWITGPFNAGYGPLYLLVCHRRKLLEAINNIVARGFS